MKHYILENEITNIIKSTSVNSKLQKPLAYFTLQTWLLQVRLSNLEIKFQRIFFRV